jgi:hypothetical protein
MAGDEKGIFFATGSRENFDTESAGEETSESFFVDRGEAFNDKIAGVAPEALLSADRCDFEAESAACDDTFLNSFVDFEDEFGNEVRLAVGGWAADLGVDIGNDESGDKALDCKDKD